MFPGGSPVQLGLYFSFGFIISLTLLFTIIVTIIMTLNNLKISAVIISTLMIIMLAASGIMSYKVSTELIAGYKRSVEMTKVQLRDKLSIIQEVEKTTFVLVTTTTQLTGMSNQLTDCVHKLSEKVSLGGAFEIADYGDGEIDNALLKGKYKNNNIYFFGFNVNWKL